MTELAPSPSQHEFPPYGLVSLWDMINFSIHAFLLIREANRQLRADLMNAYYLAVDSDEPSNEYIQNDDIQVAKELVDTSRQFLKTFGESHLVDRLNRIEAELIPSRISYEALVGRLRDFDEALIDVCMRHHFYQYPKGRGDAVKALTTSLAPIRKKFPSAAKEIEDAVDCWALDKNTASVFHSMRAAEIGLRALARERGITRIKNGPMEWAVWQDIIKDIRDDVERIISKGLIPRGQPRDDFVQFYRGVLGEFEAFKDFYRNEVCHVRRRYDAPQAASAHTHVMEFFVRLSSKTDENGEKISWD